MMITEEYTYLKGAKVPWSESANIEFKVSFSPVAKEVYIKTIGAFLNQEKGGCLLFGVDNQGIVKGFIPSVKKLNTIDHLKLMMDDIISHDLLFTDGTSLPLDKTLQVKVHPISVNEFVVVVFCSKKSSLKVTRPNGEIYVRGNASTRLWKKGPVFFTHGELTSRIQERVLQEKALKAKEMEEVSKNHIIDMDLYNQILYDYHKIERKQERHRKQEEGIMIPIRFLSIVVCFFLLANWGWR